MIFVALETQALAFYVWLPRGREIERAALKYLLLGAIARRSLCTAWRIFGVSGETSLAGIAPFVSTADDGSRSALVLAAAFWRQASGSRWRWFPSRCGCPTSRRRADAGDSTSRSPVKRPVSYSMRIFLIALGEG